MSIRYIGYNDPQAALQTADVAHFRAALTDPRLSVYACVGVETDAAWTVARTTRALFPALQIYLVSDISMLREWVPAGTPTGIVFGFDNAPDQLLDVGEAAIGRIVRQAIAGAIR